MPGNESNTNLLDALNQAIVALNELVTATNNQNLDVTVNNNVPVPSVTVNNDVPVPSVDIDFDTASIVAELSSIKDNTLDIAGDTDGLADLSTIATNSAELTNLQELPNLTAGLAIANTHFSNIADRLAPDGESIQPTLALLVNALEASVAAQSSYVEEFPTNIVTFAPTNPVKCEAARRAVGHNVKMYYYWRTNWVAAKLIAITEIGLATILTGGALAISVSGIVLTQAIDLIFSWGANEISTFYTEFTAIAEDLVCAIYEAPNAQTALDDMDTVIDGQTWSDALSPDLAKVMKPVNLVNKVFSDPTKLDPQHYGGQELGDWSTFDCSTCTASICPDDGWVEGTPAMWDGVSWTLDTITRVTGTDNIFTDPDIRFTMNTPRTVVVHALEDGATIDIFTQDCDGNIIDQNFNQTNADMPNTYNGVAHFDIHGLNGKWADLEIQS